VYASKEALQDFKHHTITEQKDHNVLLQFSRLEAIITNLMSLKEGFEKGNCSFFRIMINFHQILIKGLK